MWRFQKMENLLPLLASYLAVFISNLNLPQFSFPFQGFLYAFSSNNTELV